MSEKKIEELTVGEAIKRMGECKEEYEKLANLFNKSTELKSDNNTSNKHPMLGKRCLIRTHSAGVHIGDVVYINENNSNEVKLENAIRLWSWENGGLSLSAVANNGINGGRLNITGEVYLTNVIEFIPTTEKAEKTYAKFIED